MPFLFAITLFVSAFLLFSIQPMIAKLILPLLGGTPAVWNSCMVFFQTALLAGYSSAHLAANSFRRVGTRRHMELHLILLLFGGACLAPLLDLAGQAPKGILAPAGMTGPAVQVFVFLLATVGVPFCLVATIAPLMQHWLAGTRSAVGRDPYFLYSASNFGSMVALVCYPFLLEPWFGVEIQGRLWVGGYVVLILLLLSCTLMMRRISSMPTPDPAAPEPATIERNEAVPGFSHRLRWLALAFVPSSLLYGVTTYLSTDVAAVPLLWVIPLALYLFTFILAFAPISLVSHGTIVQILPVAVLAQTFVFALQGARPVWILFLLHLLTFTVVCLACHQELAQERPSPRHLTRFYLWLSLGGVLGGMFNALLAPLIFETFVEYPLALVLVCFLVPMADGTAAATARPRIDWHDLWMPLLLFLLLSSLSPVIKENLELVPLQVTLIYGLPAAVCYAFRARPLRFGLGVGALLLAGGLGGTGPHSKLVYSERNYFGTVRVADVADKDDPAVIHRHFIHGSTLHGMQLLSSDRRRATSPWPISRVRGRSGRFSRSCPDRARNERSRSWDWAPAPSPVTASPARSGPFTRSIRPSNAPPSSSSHTCKTAGTAARRWPWSLVTPGCRWETWLPIATI